MKSFLIVLVGIRCVVRCGYYVPPQRHNAKLSVMGVRLWRCETTIHNAQRECGEGHLEFPRCKTIASTRLNLVFPALLTWRRYPLALP